MKFLLLPPAVISLVCISGHLSPPAASESSLRLLFMGDIMGHQPQIEGAWDPLHARYDYASVFSQVAPLIREADFAVANLEVTLAGPPYSGYPRFSSPDALAEACRECGIDVLATANNHICDRGLHGLARTLGILDSLGFASTGSYRAFREMRQRRPLVLTKNGITVGLLNYTYGTNGLPTPFPALVARIDTLAMTEDLEHCLSLDLDKLIVFLHWGGEYRSLPDLSQRETADFLFRNGVDIIIGSHPHVIQPLSCEYDTATGRHSFIAWSLGNYLSNQRQPRRDGGMTVLLELTKNDSLTYISECGYYLTWVRRVDSAGHTRFSVLPCSIYEDRGYRDLSPEEGETMGRFLADTRDLMQRHTRNVEEKRFSPIEKKR
ncbi:CapA family protein [bacterium]|nr:CapA family protein [bacterium]